MHRTLSLFRIAADTASIKSASPNTLSKECNGYRKSRPSTPDANNPRPCPIISYQSVEPTTHLLEGYPRLKYSRLHLSLNHYCHELLFYCTCRVLRIQYFAHSFFFLQCSQLPIFSWLGCFGWAVAWAHTRNELHHCAVVIVVRVDG